MRVGIGFDAHALAEGRRLVVGGVDIPFERGLQGHSDGDVALHAIVDALLGAASLGDKGTHFPSSDPTLKGISSLELLRRTAELLERRGWRCGNVDVTIAAERPKLLPYLPAMGQHIAGALGIAVHQVSVKVTTTDGLGFTGRGEGMAAYAVASVEEAGP